MLVLGRREGKAIIINDNIKVTILDSRNGTTRIGIEAPKHITILREELLLKNQHKSKRPCSES